MGSGFNRTGRGERSASFENGTSHVAWSDPVGCSAIFTQGLLRAALACSSRIELMYRFVVHSCHMYRLVMKCYVWRNSASYYSLAAFVVT